MPPYGTVVIFVISPISMWCIFCFFLVRELSNRVRMVQLKRLCSASKEFGFIVFSAENHSKPIVSFAGLRLFLPSTCPALMKFDHVLRSVVKSVQHSLIA